MSITKITLFSVILCCATWVVAQSSASPGGTAPVGGSGTAGQSSTPGSTPPRAEPQLLPAKAPRRLLAALLRLRPEVRLRSRVVLPKPLHRVPARRIPAEHPTTQNPTPEQIRATRLPVIPEPRPLAIPGLAHQAVRHRAAQPRLLQAAAAALHSNSASVVSKTAAGPSAGPLFVETDREEPRARIVWNLDAKLSIRDKR